MIKLKLILFVVFLLLLSTFTYGQVKITEKGYEKAVDLANYKYVIYSMTKVKERESFIEKCNCNKDPNFDSIQNAISKTKTKTIAFSKVFDELKGFDIELYQRNIAAFLTDSIFDNNFNSEYNRVFSFGNSRKDDPEFIEYKNELAVLIIDMLNDHIIVPKVNDIEENASQMDEPVETVVYESKEANWVDEIDIFSIVISMLLSLLLIGFLYLKYFMNSVSEAVKDHVHKKVSGSYFDKRFDENQSKINSLRKEIQELKEQIKDLQASKIE